MVICGKCMEFYPHACETSSWVRGCCTFISHFFSFLFSFFLVAVERLIRLEQFTDKRKRTEIQNSKSTNDLTRKSQRTNEYTVDMCACVYLNPMIEKAMCAAQLSSALTINTTHRNVCSLMNGLNVTNYITRLKTPSDPLRMR